jgi:hypothetical protein
MKKCESCGNEYKSLFEVKMSDGVSHWFDSFECASYKLAPRCNACGIKVLGHGVQVENQIFCGAHCARTKGFTAVVDNPSIEISMAQ